MDDFYRGGTLDPAVKDVQVKTRYEQLGLTLGFSYFIFGKEAEAAP